ncbi:PREDICTED: C-type lectin domain family 4 member E isoform X2 [Chinchilla lanigera]|uniref:C-type lectin domain family 4 member E isoform X2 n=1 Tax=Chinchilla lanigera TaxID=34839 RepID=UPI00038E9C0E|nr:PREDICTED: C-type lectin domain family 4 member E isoform X2 [Chinchilla lanigera]
MNSSEPCASQCAVTYQSLRICGEKKVHPQVYFPEISCNNDGSGSVKNCCPLNWQHFQSSCYYFSTDLMTWTASLNNCSGMGAHLVVINTVEEQEFLYYTKPKKKEYYIGLSDQVVEDQWQWVDGTPFSMSFWDTGEPNNLATLEDCATIRDSLNPRKNWNDAPCFFNMLWICEMPEINILH